MPAGAAGADVAAGLVVGTRVKVGCTVGVGVSVGVAVDVGKGVEVVVAVDGSGVEVEDGGTVGLIVDVSCGVRVGSCVGATATGVSADDVQLVTMRASAKMGAMRFIDILLEAGLMARGLCHCRQICQVRKA